MRRLVLPCLGAVWLLAGTAIPGFAAGDRSPLRGGEFTAELNGLKLWYKVSGAGPVCLMPNPAWGPSSDLYFRTLKPLEKYFTVVYLDSRGTGRSQRAPATTEYTWDALVADLEALRIHLKQDRVWLMGHSEGGTQAMHYACRYPDRVSGLVLLNTCAVCDKEGSDDRGERILRRRNQPWFSAAHKAWQTRFTTDREMKQGLKNLLPLNWSDPAKMARFKDDFEAVTMSAAASDGQVHSKRYPFDLQASLRNVGAPALVVTGDDDCICSPRESRRIHLALPHSKLLIFEKCGHFPWLEQPEAFFADVPAFLDALGFHP